MFIFKGIRLFLCLRAPGLGRGSWTWTVRPVLETIRFSVSEGHLSREAASASVYFHKSFGDRVLILLKTFSLHGEPPSRSLVWFLFVSERDVSLVRPSYHPVDSFVKERTLKLKGKKPSHNRSVRLSHL